MPAAGDGAILSTSAQLLREVFEPGFTDALNRHTPLLTRFKRDSFPGQKIRWKIQHPAATTGATSYNPDSAGLPTAYAEVVKDAEIAYKANWVPIQVSNFAQAATRGQGGFVDLLAFETKNKLEVLKDHINTQLMVAKRSLMTAASTDIDGLGCIVDDGTIDSPAVTGYAGITFASNTWWKPYVKASGGVARDLTIALMQDVMAAMELPARRAKISSILCARVHYNQYGDLMAALRRFRPNEALDGGYPSIAYDGTKVVAIPGLPAGSMYFLQESDWGYYVLQNFNTRETFVNADARYFIVTHYSQLVCRALHRQARIADLPTS